MTLTRDPRPLATGPWSLAPGSCPARRRGAALVMAMVALLVVSLVAAALVQSILAGHRQARRYADELQAQWLAEAGVARALALVARDANYKGETWQAPVQRGESPAIGEVTIVVQPTDKTITIEAIYPLEEHHRALVRREIRNLKSEP